MITRIPPNHGRRSGAPSLPLKFSNMVPEIRYHARRACRGREDRQFEILAPKVVAAAFQIYSHLAERGLAHLAYPRPLAAAALVRLRQGDG